MDLFEFQGKALFARHGLPVPAGRLAASAVEAEAAARALGGRVVLKAQVLSGGRGKAGGVRVVEEASVRVEAEAILGLELGGRPVERLLVEPASAIAAEYYLSVALDRDAGRTLLLFSSAGGVEIERIAADRPAELARVEVHPLEGLSPHHLRALLGSLPPELRAAVAPVVERLHRCYLASDATLCEINPLVRTASGEILALDAKVTIDDAALYRQPELAALAPAPDPATLEGLAASLGVTYVKLDGSVGILGNGAGLSMATVDLVVLAGGRPANFCDLGGGGSADGVVSSLEVISKDPQVRTILFNIFGGITRCDEVARGILRAVEKIGLQVPLVVRLDGTNAEEGRRLLREAALPGLSVEATMIDAARRAVELAR